MPLGLKQSSPLKWFAITNQRLSTPENTVLFYYCSVADQLPVPPFSRHDPELAVYVPEAEVNAWFAVPVRLMALCTWVI